MALNNLLYFIHLLRGFGFNVEGRSYTHVGLIYVIC